MIDLYQENGQGPQDRAEAVLWGETILPWAEALLRARCAVPPDEAASQHLNSPLPRGATAAVGTHEAPSALERLRGWLALDDLDTQILILALAPYLDAELRDKYRAWQGSPLADRCSVALALRVLADSRSDRLEMLVRFRPERPLFRAGLLTTEAAPYAHGDSLVDQLLCAPQRTVDLVLGRPTLDERALGYCAIEGDGVALEQVIVPAQELLQVLQLVRHHSAYRRALATLGFSEAIPYGRGIALLFAGPPGTGKTLFARALAHATGRPLFRVFSDKLAETKDAIEPVAAALFADALLHDAILFFDECEGLFGRRGPKLGYLLAELERFEGISILATNAPQALDAALERRIVYRMDFEPPDAVGREQIWELHLPPGAPLAEDVDLSLLANQFEFTGGTIKNAVLVALNSAVARNPAAPIIDMATLEQACNSQIRTNLAELAVKSRAKLSLDHLVLPAAERERLNEILCACRTKELVQNRWGFSAQLVTGKGISCLFDGPPGTGKTLCAELLARELGRPLYRVHVPNVVSKWVGETEKNIAEIFSRSRATQAILLFDEADSLFSKRTEARSANDRYANQEINLLLQEIERYEGIVVLTTNLFSGLDDALKRRIQYRLTFPKPGPAERARLWRTLVPAQTPLSRDVNFDELGERYPFSGGNIKNAILRAAYRAASDGNQLTMDHLRDAAALECEAAEILMKT